MIRWKSCLLYNVNTEELKVIVRYKVFTFDFGFKISRELTKPGAFFYFLDSRISVRL